MQTARANGFFLSALLHGGVIALILLGTYIFQEQVKQAPKVFELVAGEGDNYAATEAPLLGVPGGQKVTMPEPPAPPPTPEPSPVQSAPVEPAPLTPAPEPAPVTKAAPAQTKPAPDAIPDFKKSVTRISKKRETRIIKQYEKQKAVEERKRKEEELKSQRMTKEEFDRRNRQSAARSGSSVKHIDTEGIRSGVVGGSANNKTGGAGGKALTREEGTELEAYFALLKQRLYEALYKPPGLSDTLVAEAEFRVGADGTLSGVRIKRSSGNSEFDQAVLEAFARVHSIGPRPDGKSEVVSLNFRMREED